MPVLANVGPGCAISLLFIGIQVVIWIIRAATRSEGGSAKSSLDLTCKRSSVDGPDGTDIEIIQPRVSGLVTAPPRGLEARFVMGLTDVSDPHGAGGSVRCVLDALSGPDGSFSWSHYFRIEPPGIKFTGQELQGIPTFGLVGLRRGWRTFLLSVRVETTSGRVLVEDEGKFRFQQMLPGPEDLASLRQDADRQIATLALAIAAIDLHIDKVEIELIKDFFREHLDDSEEDHERRQALDSALKDEWQRLKARAERPAAMVKRVCTEIQETGHETVAQLAYELCVRVAASDTGIEKREFKALDYVARTLELDEAFVKEVRDRHLRAAMFEEEQLEDSVGMSPGLSDEEKLEYLNQEYARWRPRVTHTDPEKAAEAARRIEILAKLRQELTRG